MYYARSVKVQLSCFTQALSSVVSLPAIYPLKATIFRLSVHMVQQLTFSSFPYFSTDFYLYPILHKT